MGVADELAKLKVLRDEGALSDKEFARGKARILGRRGKAARPKAEPADVLGIPLLLVPAAGLGVLFLSWQRVSGDFMLLQARDVIVSARTLRWAAVGVVLLGSAILVAVDASRYGLGKNAAHSTWGMRTGPGSWAVAQILLWLIAFPWYMATRKVASPTARNLTVGAIIMVLLFVSGVGTVTWAISARVDQVRERVERIQDGLAAPHAAAAPTAVEEPPSPPPVAADVRYGAKHILVQYKGSKRAGEGITRTKQEAKARAEEALQKLKDPTSTFEDVVKAYSDEPGAAQRGGSLGRFRKGAMDPVFEAAIEKLQVGETSGVVETPFGFHVIVRTY